MRATRMRSLKRWSYFTLGIGCALVLVISGLGQEDEPPPADQPQEKPQQQREGPPPAAAEEFSPERNDIVTRTIEHPRDGRRAVKD